MHDSVSNNFRDLESGLHDVRMSEVPDGPVNIAADILGPESIQDALMCEAVKVASIEVDAEARRRFEEGCTAVSLYTMRDRDADSTRVYCSNVGDSR